MKVIIAVPDFTREGHLKLVLPGLLSKLKKQGVSEKDIEIIIGTGLHRPPTRKEILRNIGPLAKKIRVINHNYSKKHIAYFGKTKAGIPVYLNKRLKTAGAIITVGVVEPHLYAGYSGGVKVVAIGLAGEKTINSTHHPRFLDHAGTRLCSIKNNLFREFIEDAVERLPLSYSINIINNKSGKLSRIFKGKPGPCFKEAVRHSKNIFEKRVNISPEVIICDIPSTKGVNIYQASRAFNYLVNTRKSVVKKGAAILVKAGLEEGFGKGLGEKRFMKKILEMKSPEKLIEEIKKGGCLAGEHRAYMVAKAMLKARLGFISNKAHLYKNKGLPFLFFRSQAEARKSFNKKAGFYYLRNAFETILIRSRS